MLDRLFKRAQRLPMSGLGANETTGLNIYDWAKMFAPGAQVAYNGNNYQAYQLNSSNAGATYYGSNPVVFSLASIRILLFSEARFQFQQMRGGRPGDLFGNPDLQILEEPWPGHTTRDLLAQAELDIFCAGNSYWVRDDVGLLRLDPSRVKLLTEKVTENDITGYQVGERLLAYAYIVDKDTVALYQPSEVGHYKPYPDHRNRFLGTSWLSPCLPDIGTDEIISKHKQAVISNGASLSTIVSFDPTVNREEFDGFVDRFRRQHEGADNANKTLFLGGGADVKTVGQTFENLALQATQGSGEVRIASCAGVPPVIVGFSEGLKGSTLNAGNYGQARRRLSDGTMRPLWGAFASCMQSIVPPPAGARLWYDDRDIAFLREDLSDQADILTKNAASIVQLIQGGFKPDAAIEAVQTGDLTRLAHNHTGLFSVQLQPPSNGAMGQPAPAPNGTPAANGNTPTPAPVP